MSGVADWIAQKVADLARPYTFYSLATASAVSIVKMSWGITDGYQAAALAGVTLAGASAIYIGKAVEETRKAGQSAEVEKIRATANPPPATALAPATTDAAPVDDHDPAMYGGPRG